jgi:hypothetical protein
MSARADRFATSPAQRLTVPVGRMVTDHRCQVCDAPIGHDPRLTGTDARAWRHMATTPTAAARLDRAHAAVAR